jgi:hypothetical protein
MAIFRRFPIDAKRFYKDLGWRLDADFVRGDGSRAVHLIASGLARLDPARFGICGAKKCTSFN